MKIHPTLRLWTLIISGFAVLPVTLSAQTLQHMINSYRGENARNYLQPFSDLQSSALHTGMFTRARPDTGGLYIGLGVHLMASIPSQKMKHFEATTDFGFEPMQSATVPTIVGPNETVEVEGVNGTAFIFPSGYNIRYVPLASPQLTVGGIFNTEVMLRYLGFNLQDDQGEIRFLGFAVRHALDDYLPDLPVSLSLAYSFHQLSWNPYIVSQHHLLSLHLGRRSELWSWHLTLGYQNAKSEFNYTFGSTDTETDEQIITEAPFPLFTDINGSLQLGPIRLGAAVGYSGALSAAINLGIYF